MSDGSSSRSIVKGLKNELSLFMEVFQGEDSESKESMTPVQETLTLEDIRSMTKVLSEDRKKLNQRLESLNKELDLNAAKLESLRLVGGDHEGTLSRIHELNDLGLSLAESLEKIDQKLKQARLQEEALREELITT